MCDKPVTTKIFFPSDALNLKKTENITEQMGQCWLALFIIEIN